MFLDEYKKTSCRYVLDRQITLGKVVDNSTFFEQQSIAIELVTMLPNAPVTAFVAQNLLHKGWGEVVVPPIESHVIVLLFECALHVPIVIGYWPNDKSPIPQIEEIQEFKEGFFQYQITPSGMVMMIYDDGENSYIKMRDINNDMNLLFDTTHKIIDLQSAQERIILDGTSKKTSIFATEMEINIEKTLKLSSKKLEVTTKEQNMKVEQMKAQYRKRYQTGKVWTEKVNKISLQTLKNKVKI